LSDRNSSKNADTKDVKVSLIKKVNLYIVYKVTASKLIMVKTVMPGK